MSELLKQKNIGQGLVEYAVVILLVALALVVMLTLYGSTLGNYYNYIVSAIPN